MRQIIIGGGVSALALALRAVKRGDEVVVLEKAAEIGGLTSTQTLESPGGPVQVDRFYHVILESDERLLGLLDELGLRDLVRWTAAPAELISDGRQYPASSLVEMATLPALKLADRLRIGASIAACLATPMAVADRTTSAALLRRLAGESAYREFWGPILSAKLGTQADLVSGAFIVSTFRRLVQARLKGAGDRFGVIPGGYGPVFAALRDRLQERGAVLRTGCDVTGVRSQLGDGGRPTVTVTLADGEVVTGDRAFVTAPGPIARRIVPQLADAEGVQLTDAPYLGVVCGVFLMDEAPNDSYITYLTDDVGLTGVIGMHALLPAEQTGGGHLVYLPHYCASDDAWFEESDEVLRERLLDAMRACFPAYRGQVIDGTVNRARFVVPLPLPQGVPPLPFASSVPGVHVVSTAQNRTGTLNVENSLMMVDDAYLAIFGSGK